MAQLRKFIVAAVVFLAAAIGFVIDFGELVQYFQTADNEWWLVDDGTEIDLTSESVADEDRIVKSTIRVHGKVVLPEGFLLVADRLNMADGASLVVTKQATILATRISGGLINARGKDGSDGKGPGSKGEAGGHGSNVFVATAEANGLRIDASGGRGGHGVAGRDGADGRKGKCKPGGWQKANPGDNGQPGGNGGPGGNAGEVVVISSHPLASAPVAVGGTGGEGKPGGAGGRGGAGCTGLGGSQSTRESGKLGPAGEPGSKGEDTHQPEIRRVRFKRVVEVWKALRDAPVKELRDEIMRASSGT